MNDLFPGGLGGAKPTEVKPIFVINGCVYSPTKADRERAEGYKRTGANADTALQLAIMDNLEAVLKAGKLTDVSVHSVAYHSGLPQEDQDQEPPIAGRVIAMKLGGEAAAKFEDFANNEGWKKVNDSSLPSFVQQSFDKEGEFRPHDPKKVALPSSPENRTRGLKQAGADGKLTVDPSDADKPDAPEAEKGPQSTEALAAALWEKRPDISRRINRVLDPLGRYISGVGSKYEDTKHLHAELDKAQEYVNAQMLDAKEPKDIEAREIALELIQRQRRILDLTAEQKQQLMEEDRVRVGSVYKKPTKDKEEKDQAYSGDLEMHMAFVESLSEQLLTREDFQRMPFGALRDARECYDKKYADGKAWGNIADKLHKILDGKEPFEAIVSAFFTFLLDLVRMREKQIVSNEVDRMLDELEKNPDELAKLQTELKASQKAEDADPETRLVKDGQLNAEVLSKLQPAEAAKYIYAGRAMNLKAPSGGGKYENMLKELTTQADNHLRGEKLRDEQARRRGNIEPQKRGVDKGEAPLTIEASVPGGAGGAAKAVFEVVPPVGPRP